MNDFTSSSFTKMRLNRRRNLIQYVNSSNSPLYYAADDDGKTHA